MKRQKKLKKKFVVIFFGPTGVGKSSFAEQLADKIPSQIINCDIGQFYTPLTIGTAKPIGWRSKPVTHRLFDIIDEPRYFNVCEYREILFKIVNEIWEKNELPILVGGSGFYLKSLFFPPISYDMLQPQEDKKDICGVDPWDLLYNIDPERASKIKKNDLYRIERALEIWKTTGKKPSECIPVFDFPSNFMLLFLTRDKKELYERIDTRLIQMLDEGWIEEVESLQNTEWEDFLKKKKIIGYDIILEYLYKGKREENKQRVIAEIQKKTKNYAKRQITFWKSFKKQIIKEISEYDDTFKESKVDAINLTLLDRDLYIKKLLNILKPLFE